jgi:hypothetical protein
LDNDDDQLVTLQELVRVDYVKPAFELYLYRWRNIEWGGIDSIKRLVM